MSIVSGLIALTSATPPNAEAAPFDFGWRETQATPSLIDVQYRREHDRGYRGRHGYRGGDRRQRGGNGLAAGLAGVAAGAIIGGAIASQAAPRYAAPAPAYGSCAQRFRSYDPASGTYLGYDGARHPCP